MSYGPDAIWYDQWVRERAVVHRVAVPALLELCGPGDLVLDLACGQGILTRELAAGGRIVTGVDLSSGLIEIAREEEAREPRGIEYLEEDACSLSAFGVGSFDGVASCLALTDIDDLVAAFAAVHRVLKPGGWFAFATVHPCFETPHSRTVEEEGRTWRQVGRYFEEGRWFPPSGEGPRARLGAHHRRLSTIVNLLLETGFTLDRLAEPKATPNVVDRLPVYGEIAEVLAARFTR